MSMRISLRIQTTLRYSLAMGSQVDRACVGEPGRRGRLATQSSCRASLPARAGPQQLARTRSLGGHDPGFILGNDQAVDVEPKLFADLSVVSDTRVKNHLDAAVEIEADRGNHALEAGHAILGAIPKDG
ncbi:TPA: hypothetical protein NOV85_003379 [Pseudomonas aeruginosa]|nr:hypothetical protein [Pseudomonas aeruginosa]HCI3180706.1 hypothetical protein [Pseudomonas aeruginosa]HCJ0856971.1 hypothetical protein [Pseudomonas aeruginosa]